MDFNFPNKPFTGIAHLIPHVSKE